MGSACIKVTKYFLFLFNLLFFVSMTRTRLSYWGQASLRTLQRPQARDGSGTRSVGAEDRPLQMQLGGASQEIACTPAGSVKSTGCLSQLSPVLQH